MFFPQVVKKSTFFAFLMVAILTSGPSVNANETDWKPDPSNLKNLDGVAVRCIVSSERKFVDQMCKTLIEVSKEKALGKKLKFASAGITWMRNTDDTYRSAVLAARIAQPLLLEFFIRGTDGEPVSGSIQILASVEYAGAIEKGRDNSPRSGRLVIWENAGTASGPANDLAPALAGHMVKKLDLLFGGFTDVN